MTMSICAAFIDNRFISTATCFLVVLSFWTINYISLELEMPFGDDPNDLPLVDMQQEFNSSLGALLQSSGQDLPELAEESRSITKLRQSVIKQHSVMDFSLYDAMHDDESDIDSSVGKNDGEFRDATDDLQAALAKFESIDSKQDFHADDTGRFRAARLLEESELEHVPPRSDGFVRTTSEPPSLAEAARVRLDRLGSSSDHLGSRTNLQAKKDESRSSRLSTEGTPSRSDLAAVFRQARQALQEKLVEAVKSPSRGRSRSPEQQSEREIILM